MNILFWRPKGVGTADVAEMEILNSVWTALSRFGMGTGEGMWKALLSAVVNDKPASSKLWMRGASGSQSKL